MKNIAKVLSVFVLLFVSVGWGETPGGGPIVDGSGTIIGGAPDGNYGIGGAGRCDCDLKNVAVGGDRGSVKGSLRAASGFNNGANGTDKRP